MFHVASKVLCEYREKYLILTRGPGYKEGYDDCPGGRLESMEDVEEAVKREIEEEIGIDQIKDLQIFEAKHVVGGKQNKEFIMLYYHCYLLDNRITLSHEHTDYRWIDKVGEKDLEPWIQEIIDIYASK